MKVVIKLLTFQFFFEEIGFLPTCIWSSNTGRSHETAVIITRECQLGQNRCTTFTPFPPFESFFIKILINSSILIIYLKYRRFYLSYSGVCYLRTVFVQALFNTSFLLSLSPSLSLPLSHAISLSLSLFPPLTHSSHSLPLQNCASL